MIVSGDEAGPFIRDPFGGVDIPPSSLARRGLGCGARGLNPVAPGLRSRGLLVSSPKALLYWGWAFLEFEEPSIGS